MVYKDKFAAVLMLLCFLFPPKMANALDFSSFLSTLATKHNQKSSDRVLAGLVVRHGEIIDAIQPIYRKINDNGSLGETTKEQQQGGNGGNLTEIYRDDFVVVGFIYSIGEWMGEKRIAGLYTVLQKWENGKPSGDRIIFGPFGLIDKIYSGQAILKTPSEGLYVSNLQVSTSDQFVSDINISFSGEAEVPKSEPTVKNINLPYDSKDNYYKFDVKIISGSKTGQVLQGIVSFPYDKPSENASANRFILHYEDNCYEIDDLDGNPSAKIDDNNFSNLAFVGGPNNNRFGLNAGFGRNQFGRNEESFVRNGEEYFGYLRPDTIVDGVGTVQYRKLDDNEKSLYNELLCK